MQLCSASRLLLSLRPQIPLLLPQMLLPAGVWSAGMRPRAPAHCFSDLQLSSEPSTLSAPGQEEKHFGRMTTGPTSLLSVETTTFALSPPASGGGTGDGTGPGPGAVQRPANVWSRWRSEELQSEAHDCWRAFLAQQPMVSPVTVPTPGQSRMQHGGEPGLGEQVGLGPGLGAGVGTGAGGKGPGRVGSRPGRTLQVAGQ